MMTNQRPNGPLSERTWGRVWAQHFIDSISSTPTLLEKNPRQAVKDLLGKEVDPLYDPMQKGRKKKHCARDLYQALEDLKRVGTKVQDLRDGTNLFDRDIQQVIAQLNHGNKWILIHRESKVEFSLQQNIRGGRGKHGGGGPKSVQEPLTLTEWISVYAEAILDGIFNTNFLKKDVTAAVQNFVGKYPTSFQHNSASPILKFPTFTELLTGLRTLPSTSPFAELQNSGNLETVLQELADDIDTDYETTVRVCLCC